MRLISRPVAIAATICVALVAAAGLLAVHRATLRRPSAADTVRSYDYGAASLTAHFDAARTDAPWLVIVHGGYWARGSRTEFDTWANELESTGYQVFSVDYRLSSVAPWPAQADDVKQAAAWIRSHASTFRIDPTRAGIIGQSAGAQIASVVGAELTGADRFTTVIDLDGPVNPYDGWQWSHGVVRTGNSRRTQLGDYATLLMGCPPVKWNAGCWARWVDAEADSHVARGEPPVLILHDDRDPVVPVAQARSYSQHLAAAGVGRSLIIFHSDVHSARSNPQATRDIDDWLNEHLPVRAGSALGLTG